MAQLHTDLQRLHPKYGIMFSIGVDTGLRISDIINLRVRDLLRGKAVKSEFTVIERKTQKQRTVSITPDTVKEIRGFIRFYGLSASEYLVFSRQYSKPISRQMAWKAVSSVSRLNGLKNVAPHSMRKTYAKTKYHSHGSINTLKNDFNHSAMEITAKYLVSPEQAEELERVLNEFLSL